MTMATTAAQTSTRPSGLSLHSTSAVPKDVFTVLNFHKDNEDGSPPQPSYVNKPESYFRSADSHRVTIHDIRGKEDEFSIYKQGFQIHRHVSQEKEFVDDERIKSVYYPETEKLLKDVTGAKRIFIFDHTIRRNSNGSSPQKGGPVQHVHIDQSAAASRSRVPLHLPDDAERLSQSRFQIINVWRPIKTIRRDPLAVADSSTVRDEDLVAIPLIYPNRNGETLGVRYNEGQRFYYKSGLTPEEVILIKCFDSEDGLRVPHSAFVDADTEGIEEARESIEVRALVFHAAE